MNRKTLVLVPIMAIAALALTAVGLAIPQQALAWGHYHHHHNNGIKVNQIINQENDCSFSECVNEANNQADIHR